jgi:hypothetical protein
MLVTAASFLHPWQAHLFRMRLEAEGIAAVIADEHLVSVDWPMAMALGGVKVQVPEALLDEARAVKAECDAGVYEAALEREFGAEDALSCPQCGAGEIVRRKPRAWLLALLASFMWTGVIFPVRASRCTCAACGATWEEGEADAQQQAP